MERIQCSCGSISLIGIMLTAILTFAASWLVSLISYKRVTREKKTADVAGAKAILKMYLKEVNAGLTVIAQLSKGANIPMPTSAWKNPFCQLTPDMIAVIVSSDDGRQKYSGFQTCDFMEHTMNYFEYLCPNVDSAVQSKSPNLTSILLTAQEAASGVAAMLTRIHGNLSK